MKRFHLVAAALVIVLTPGVAAACSPTPGYRAPSNLALVGETQTIVLARVVGGMLNETEPEESTVTIRPFAAIKGPLPDGDIALRGMLLASDVGEGSGVLSNPYELEQAHPVSNWGACIRYVFPLGTTALFFLRTDHEGMWAPAGGAFSRWAEDVPDAQAPWVQLVRLYTIAAALPEADRAPFLADEREALLARTGEPVAQLMAEDIARQLAPPAVVGERLEDAFVEPGEESAVEAALEAMRGSAGEAGN